MTENETPIENEAEKTPAVEDPPEAPGGEQATEEPQEPTFAQPESPSANPVRNIAQQANLDFLLDVPLQITVELGRARITISELLELSKGSVLELDKVAGEPLDFRVNDRLVARGEAVVVNDKFGVRLTDISSPSERVQHLT